MKTKRSTFKRHGSASHSRGGGRRKMPRTHGMGVRFVTVRDDEKDRAALRDLGAKWVARRVARTQPASFHPNKLRELMEKEPATFVRVMAAIQKRKRQVARQACGMKAT